MGVSDLDNFNLKKKKEKNQTKKKLIIIMYKGLF